MAPRCSALSRLLLLGIGLVSIRPGLLVSCQNAERFGLSLSTETFARDCVGREDEKLFVLSFDDGPFHHTEQIMDILDRKGAPATFFVIGSQFQNWPGLAEKFEGLVRRMLREGHVVANHGIDNDEFTLDDVEACHEKIKSITGGYEMKYFRPAQGAYTIEKYEELVERNYKMIMWNLDIQDWRKEKSPEEMLEEVKRAVQEPTLKPPDSDKANFGLPRRGSYIMLAHDYHDKMLQIVPGGQTLLATMIDEIRNAGYRIVSLDECLAGSDAPSSDSEETNEPVQLGGQRNGEEEDWDWSHLQNSSSSTARISFLVLNLLASCGLAHLL